MITPPTKNREQQTVYIPLTGSFFRLRRNAPKEHNMETAPYKIQKYRESFLEMHNWGDIRKIPRLYICAEKQVSEQGAQAKTIIVRPLMDTVNVEDFEQWQPGDLIKKRFICQKDDQLLQQKIENEIATLKLFYKIKVFKYEKNNPINVVYEVLMPRAPGITLNSFLTKVKNDVIQLPLAKKEELALNLCIALEKFHALKLVHRDLKPRNIIVDPKTLQVKIIDFGSITSTSKIIDLTDGITTEYAPQEILALSQSYRESGDKHVLLGKPALSIDIFALTINMINIFSGDPHLDNAHLTLSAATFEPKNPNLLALLANGVAENPAQRPSVTSFVTCLSNIIEERNNPHPSDDRHDTKPTEVYSWTHSTM